jgi:hypothetical protein
MSEIARTETDEPRTRAWKVDGDRAHLQNNLREFERAWSELLTLGEAMIACMDTIDTTRHEMTRHGISLGVDPGELGLIEVDAALRRHRELRRDRDHDLDAPEFLR